MRPAIYALAGAAAVASAQHTFYYIGLETPNGVNITQFGGTLTVPEYPPGYPASGETYYLWPGLIRTGGNDVFQQVLEPDSSGGTWGIDSGDYPDTSFQGGLYGLQPGQQIYFNNYDDGNGQWTTQFAYAGQPVTVTDQFNNTQGLSWNIATWSIELYNAPWNFGEFLFTDTYVRWASEDTSACCDTCVYAYNTFNYAVEGASASVQDGQTTCTFSVVRLTSP